jgi:hypothetical protein
MKFLLSLFITALIWFLYGFWDNSGFPDADYWRFVLTPREIPITMLFTLLFFILSCVIVYSIAAIMRKKAIAAIVTRPLPWRIESNNEIFALATKFGVTLIVSKSNLKRLRTFVAPEESLYFAAGLATTYIFDLNDLTDLPHQMMLDLFISDQRVLLCHENVGELHSFPLQEIVSIGFEEKSFSFSTEDTIVYFTASMVRSDAQEIYDAFVQALTAADVVFSELDINAVWVAVRAATKAISQTQNAIRFHAEPILQTQRVVECPGCGAAVNVIVGQTSQCEYCRRVVSG